MTQFDAIFARLDDPDYRRTFIKDADAEIRRLEVENAGLLSGRSALDDAYTGWVLSRLTGNTAVEHEYAQKLSTAVFYYLSITKPAEPLEGETPDLIGGSDE